MKKRTMSEDIDAGSRARDAGIDRASLGASHTWKTEALQAVARAAAKYEFFTTDEVWAEMAGAETTHEPRAMGAVMRTAVAMGWCTGTSVWRQTSRPTAHRRPCAVWRSKLVGGT